MRWLLLVAALAAPVAAQVPDDIRASPADSLADSGDVPPGSSPTRAVGPFGSTVGDAVTPVPAVTASLDVGGLVGDELGAFAYALGAPGRTGGVALDSRDLASLTLDGRPFDDVVTGAPRLDLLPLGVIGPLGRRRMGDAALSAQLRSLRLEVPITELRYLGGQDGLRHASGTHAQTRRAPGFMGGERGRVTASFHAASRAAAGPLAGATLSHTDAVGRVLLTRPGVAIETGVVYTDHTEGARRGVVSDTPDGIFEFDTGRARDADALRQTLRTEGWMRARIPLAARPLEVGVSGVVQRLIYTTDSLSNVRIHGRRVTGFAEQPFAVGGHRLSFRLDGVFDAAPDTASGAFAAAGSRLALHASASDSLRIAGLDLAASVGGHRVGDDVWPSAAVRVRRGRLAAGVWLDGRARPRIAETGLGRIEGVADGPTSRSLGGDVALGATVGDWRGRVRAFASAERDGWHLVALSDTVLTYRTASVTQGGLAAEVGWREASQRGLYARAQATTRAVADATDDLPERIDQALPRVWGALRVGVRAENVGDGVLDLDLAAVGRAWTGFRSRLVDPATGLLALPRPGDPLGTELPARGTLGLEATATFETRASLFVRYDHAVGDRLYDGAIVTQGEPLAPHVFRFGVFWALLN